MEEIELQETEYAGLPTEILDKIREELQKDILERYDNEEYWNWEVAKNIARDKGYIVTDLDNLI